MQMIIQQMPTALQMVPCVMLITLESVPRVSQTSFNFSNNSSSPISHGANALKLENEVTSNSENQPIVKEDINQINNLYHEELLRSYQASDVVENTSEQELSFTQEATQEQRSYENEEEVKNDLSEFGVDSHAPDLFNNDSETSNSNDLLSSESEDQDDDLEIPAFLRRQKN